MPGILPKRLFKTPLPACRFVPDIFEEKMTPAFVDAAVKKSIKHLQVCLRLATA